MLRLRFISCPNESDITCSCRAQLMIADPTRHATIQLLRTSSQSFVQQAAHFPRLKLKVGRFGLMADWVSPHHTSRRARGKLVLLLLKGEPSAFWQVTSARSIAVSVASNSLARSSLDLHTVITQHETGDGFRMSPESRPV